MNKEQVKNLIGYTETDWQVFINNSIFVDLLKCQDLKHISRKAYAYGYYSLITYLYINGKYRINLLKQSELKEILGFSPDHRGLDEISKKNGLLDLMGYTETVADFPVRLDNGKQISFVMYRDSPKNISFNNNVSNNYKVKYPIKAFYRDEKSKKEGHLNGSFYYADDCHSFDVECFLNCVSNESIGCVGFFIVSYIKFLGISLRTGSYSNTKEVWEALGLTRKTFSKYINLLAREGLLDVDFRHNQDVKEISLYLRQQLNDWREVCLAKYGNRCIISGSNQNLHVHHVHEPFGLIRDRIFDQSGIKYKPFSEYSKEELEFLSYRVVQAHQEIEGVPLRKDLHNLLHNLFGNSPSKGNLNELKNRYFTGEFRN